MKKYLVGVLYYGAIDREHDRCIRNLKGNALVHDVMELTGCPYIDMGRSLIATAVLDDPELGGVMFIDHDMVFEPQEVELCILGAESVAGTCGAAYSMRRPGRIIGAVEGGKLAPGERVVFFEGGKLYPANYLGMGMTAISRGVLVNLVKASRDRHRCQQDNLAKLRSYLTLAASPDGVLTKGDLQHAAELLELLVPELRQPDLPRLTTGLSEAPVVPFFSHLQRIMKNPEGRDGYYFGEDVSFCIRSHEAEQPVLLESRARVYHKGSYHYGLEDVGMQVPYCTRLEAIDPGGEPEPRVALHSKDSAVQAALEAAHPELALSAPLPERAPAAAELPASYPEATP